MCHLVLLPLVEGSGANKRFLFPLNGLFRLSPPPPTGESKCFLLQNAVQKYGQNIHPRHGNSCEGFAFTEECSRVAGRTLHTTAFIDFFPGTCSDSASIRVVKGGLSLAGEGLCSGKKHFSPAFPLEKLEKKSQLFPIRTIFCRVFSVLYPDLLPPFFSDTVFFLSQETHFYNPWGGRETLHSYIPPPLFIKRGVEEEKDEFKVPSTDWKEEKREREREISNLKHPCPLLPPLNFFPGSS